MAESAQEQQTWAEQEKGYRRLEGQIGLRWAFTIFPLLSLLQAWEGYRYAHSPWHTVLALLVFVATACYGVHLWALSVRYSRAVRAARAGDRAEPPAV